jgi:sugar lactone lactonase YvrE
MDLAGNLVERMDFHQRIGAAIPTGRRTFVVALERELARLDLETRSWKVIAGPPLLPEGSRFNDGKGDPSGRWVIGTLSMRGDPGTSALYSLRADESLHCLRGGVTISNGIAWTADGATMYYIDTPTRCVVAYNYDAVSGAISGEREVLRFSDDEGWPDGMTIDREGRLWIGFWDGWAVRCYRPETGNCEAVVPMPCARPTSCCFGGPDLDLLFITTARVGLSEDELLRQPLAGSVFVGRPGARGFPTTHFA